MTRHGITVMMEVVLLLPLATLSFQLAKRKTLVGGRLVGWRERPGAVWLWLAFDLFVALLAWRLIEWIERGRFWP